MHTNNQRRRYCDRADQAVVSDELRACTAASYVVFAVIALAGGCGSSDLPLLGTVSGVVTLDGEPLPNAVVRFLPSAGRGSQARTAADGSYRLIYIRGEEGALLGEHLVTISTQTTIEDPQTHEITVQREKAPARYNAKSDLTRTVKAGRNVIDFQLTSK